MLFLCLEQFVCLLHCLLQFLLVVPERREVSCTLTIRGITSQQFSYFHLCLLADGTSLTHFLLYLLQCLRRFRLSNLVPQHSTQFTHRRGIGFSIVLVRLAKCCFLATGQCSITCSLRHCLVCTFHISQCSYLLAKSAQITSILIENLLFHITILIRTFLCLLQFLKQGVYLLLLSCHLRLCITEGSVHLFLSFSSFTGSVPEYHKRRRNAQHCR